MLKSGFKIVWDQGRCGLVDAQDRVVLPCAYDKILDYDADGYVRFLLDGTYGTVDLEGRVCIPLAEGLKHLGVFHSGSARASKDDRWGLVDAWAKPVGEFAYTTIDAYNHGGYVAIRVDGVRGHLSPQGVFTPQKSPKPKPQELVERFRFSLFDETSFWDQLASWTGNYFHSLQFYYRDTDAAIQVDALYKRGQVLWIDQPLTLNPRLQRPVHRIRFLIASRLVPLSDSDTDMDRQNSRSSNPACRLDAHSCFLVCDVQRCGSVSQVVLLHLPQPVVFLAEKYRLNLGKFKAKDCFGMPLVQAAEYDLQHKLCACVHGDSLSEERVREMYQPVGLDSSMQLVSSHRLLAQSTRDSIQSTSMYVGNYEWEERRFLTTSSFELEVRLGALSREKGDFVFLPHPQSTDPESDCLRRVYRDLDPELGRCGEQNLEKKAGSVFISDPFTWNCDAVYHVRIPHNEVASTFHIKHLKGAVKRFLRYATQHKAQKIVFAAENFMADQELKSFLCALFEPVFARKFHANIRIVCRSSAEFDFFKKALTQIAEHDRISEDLFMKYV